MTRNRLFFIGVVTLLLGLHFRVVESFVLNEKASEFWAKRFDKPALARNRDRLDTFEVSAEEWWDQPAVAPSTGKRTITPPKWLALSFISVGSVLILTCPCFR